MKILVGVLLAGALLLTGLYCYVRLAVWAARHEVDRRFKRWLRLTFTFTD